MSYKTRHTFSIYFGLSLTPVSLCLYVCACPSLSVCVCLCLCLCLSLSLSLSLYFSKDDTRQSCLTILSAIIFLRYFPYFTLTPDRCVHISLIKLYMDERGISSSYSNWLLQLETSYQKLIKFF